MITTPQEVTALLIQNYPLLRGGHNRVSNSPHPVSDDQRVAYIMTGDIIGEHGIETSNLSSRYIMAAVAAVSGAAKRAREEKRKAFYARKNQLLDVVLVRDEEKLVIKYFDEYAVPTNYRKSYLIRVSGWNAHIPHDKIDELSKNGKGLLRLAYEDYLLEKSVGKNLEFPVR